MATPLLCAREPVGWLWRQLRCCAACRSKSREGSSTAIIGPTGMARRRCCDDFRLGATRARARCTFAGLDLTHRRADEIVAAGIVHVPQGDLLFPDMTVLENLQMGAYLPEAASRCATRLEEVFALLPKLQGAQQPDRQHAVRRRAAHGRHRPRPDGRRQVLMLDEPSLGLAPIVIDQIYK